MSTELEHTQSSALTPAALGFRMPAEWELHEATWISWPHNRDTWPGAFEPIPDVFGEIVARLTESELVRINVDGPDMELAARRAIDAAGGARDRVRFHVNPTNDCWVRDHGPIYVVRGKQRERAIVDWGYNAWGEKYPPFDLDNAIPGRVAAEFREYAFQPSMVLEGGSIEVNGRGVLLTTESCLLNPNRNPHLSKAEIEQRLRDYLGVTRIEWLESGIVGDDTDGHIDDITRFVAPDTIVTAIEDEKGDPNHLPLAENLRRLQALRQNSGDAFRIVTLPMPDPVHVQEQRIPASYANFLIANTRVLVPVFGQRKDREALQILQELFPDRRVVGIDCTDLAWGLGAIHCATQQQPIGTPWAGPEANPVDDSASRTAS